MSSRWSWQTERPYTISCYKSRTPCIIVEACSITEAFVGLIRRSTYFLIEKKKRWKVYFFLLSDSRLQRKLHSRVNVCHQDASQLQFSHEGNNSRHMQETHFRAAHVLLQTTASSYFSVGETWPFLSWVIFFERLGNAQKLIGILRCSRASRCQKAHCDHTLLNSFTSRTYFTCSAETSPIRSS